MEYMKKILRHRMDNSVNYSFRDYSNVFTCALNHALHRSTS